MVTATYADNPKHAAGAVKLDYSAVSGIAEIEWVKAHENGMEKYGYQNWRTTGVDERTYYAAIRRHLMDWLNGEDCAPDSGVHHLGHVMAGAAILIDAQHHGVLTRNWNDSEVKAIPADGKASNMEAKNRESGE